MKIQNILASAVYTQRLMRYLDYLNDDFQVTSILIKENIYDYSYLSEVHKIFHVKTKNQKTNRFLFLSSFFINITGKMADAFLMFKSINATLRLLCHK